MATAMPNIDTVDVTNTDIVTKDDIQNTTPMVTTTVHTPSSSGTAAAASEPNTASSTIRTIGMFHFSASATSCLVASDAAAPRAPWPITYRRTRPSAVSPGWSPSMPTLARNCLATSTAPVFSKSRRSDTT
jgi:hypothetical protein